MTVDLFNVVQFFQDGSYEHVRQDVEAREAVETAKSYTERPAALLGIIAKIIITDGGDNTVFRWEHGKGVVFPTREQAAAAAREQGGD